MYCDAMYVLMYDDYAKNTNLIISKLIYAK